MQQWMNDVPRATAEAQRELRAGVPDLAGRFGRLSEALNDEVSAIRAEQAAGGAVPELAFADVAAGTVTPQQQARIRRRGCVVVRGVFERAQAEAWNAEVGRYIDAVGYLDRMKDKAGLDKYFSALASSRPQIYSLYWSKPQMEARQHANQATTRAWLNRLWTFEKNGRRFFDPDRQFNYADRIRRREPGDASLGLSPHSDGGSVERWCEPSFRPLYREVFEGDPLAFDPFDAEHRIATKEIPSPAVCSAFRTFQGWTALSRQGPGDGTLRLVPVAASTPWMLLRALQPDVPEGDLCGAQPGRALGASPQWHAPLLAGLVSIPVMEPGDAIFWHSDVIHAVEDRHGGTGPSNVIYIGAAPWCHKNEAFAQRQAAAFLEGRSSPDFAPEDYELGFAGRATLDELSPLGQQQMGLRPWA
ncbi:YbiU family protein [Pelomonas sp. KK5]|uniref:YbiU family protein n=1 Tax=Pelomonas sp. KK5 TaxID=1855730 RepID=UPI00097C7FC4|nr:YbiU family protein [Pelomonas sp. KK5]